MESQVPTSSKMDSLLSSGVDSQSSEGSTLCSKTQLGPNSLQGNQKREVNSDTMNKVWHDLSQLGIFGGQQKFVC